MKWLRQNDISFSNGSRALTYSAWSSEKGKFTFAISKEKNDDSFVASAKPFGCLPLDGSTTFLGEFKTRLLAQKACEEFARMKLS